MRCLHSLPIRWIVVLLAHVFVAPSVAAEAQEPLHKTIDRLVQAKFPEAPVAPRSDDAEFARRVHLDLVGRIPTADELRGFLADPDSNKRAMLIDRLMGSPENTDHLVDLCNTLLMERRGENKEWREYLKRSLAANKPWTQLVREVICPDPKDETQKGAEFFITKRLEHEGQEPIDYPGLTRDVGRLFLGVDLQCCQCHDHLTVEDYKQQEFQGLLVVFQNISVQGPRLAEKPTTAKTEFVSVFDPAKKDTAPRVPFGKEFEIPQLAAGEEFAVAPDPSKQEPGVLKFSPLKQLSENLPAAENKFFARNVANRLWFAMLGRGLVMPLDLHHAKNPPANPELLEALAEAMIAHGFDLRYLLREIALSETYQRTSHVAALATAPPADQFAVGGEKRLSAEQLMRSALVATGQQALLTASADAAAQTDALRTKFASAFGNPPAQPEVEFAPSLKAALFLMNDKTILGWLQPQPGNLVDRLSKIDESDKLVVELYQSVLSRLPTDAERTEVADHLAANADRRAAAIIDLAWALLASTEFCLNH